nr:MAG TPA: hypothetical protein [Caudoviricetes sp.]DAW50818.1 MAG TPA: hypothetical protein [Caudoviricetes sp.]
MLERSAGIRYPAPKGAAAGTKQLSAKLAANIVATAIAFTLTLIFD